MSTTPQNNSAAWEVKLSSVPSELRAKKIWCTWTKANKVPRAKSNDPDTWTSFEDACRAADADDTLGVGVMADGTCGFVDLDKCRDTTTGEIAPWAASIVRRLNGYAELSPSGTGLHVFVDSTVPASVKKNNVEMYSTGRYFTVTGEHVSGEFAPCFDIASIREDVAAGRIGCHAAPPSMVITAPMSLERLEAGESPNNDASEGDYQFVALLAEQGLTDAQIDERFSSSGRMRDKWNRNAGQGMTYGQRTIATVRKKQAAPRGPKIDLDHSVYYGMSARALVNKPMPEREPLITTDNGATLLYRKFTGQIFSYRGVGKSLYTLGLVKLLTVGGEWMRYRGKGGYRVLVVDGELPEELLQNRVAKHVGDTDLLNFISPEWLPSYTLPALWSEEGQKWILAQIAHFKPDVLIFDTLTACFKFDTNDTEKWSAVNQFLIQLRMQGLCTLLVHHAGKNGTQRGRTDGDDHLDLIVKLESPQGWSPGDGCEFNATYEKVRSGDHLRPFNAKFDDHNGWVENVDASEAEAVRLFGAGKSTRSVALSTGLSQSAVSRLQRRMKQQGIVFGKADEPPAQQTTQPQQ